MPFYTPEEIDTFLSGIDVQNNRFIAAKLGEIGHNAICHLPRLFDLVRQCYLQIPHEDIRMAQVVAWGSRSMGTLVRCAGYAPGFHDSVLSWLLDLTDNPHALLAELATWGLGDFGVPPDAVRMHLLAKARGPLRDSEPVHATIRSVAFRMLARTSRADAELLQDSPAATEYLQSVDDWIEELIASGREGNWAHVMHVDESAWLRTRKIP